MITRNFVIREDDNGNIGWALKNAPAHFDSASSGMLIAHDSIEHDKSGFDLAGELRAFGAMLYIRAGGSYWSNFTHSRYTEFAQQAADDIVRFVFQDAQGFVQNPGRTTRIDSWAEDEIDALETEVRRLINTEIDTEDIGECLHRFGLAMERMRGWMRKGYRATVRRFHGASSFALCSLFYDIEQACEQSHVFKNPEAYNTLRISINPRSLESVVSFDESFED